MKSQKKIAVDLRKKYEFPQNTYVKAIDGVFVVVAIEIANWVVLENEEQVAIFEKLKSATIGEVFNQLVSESHGQNEIIVKQKQNLVKVLTEIEAKKFDDKEQTSLNEEGMTLYLTNKCNLRCKHCYMYSGQAEEKELSLEEIKKLLKDFRTFGGKGVTFTGGEVTQRDDLVEILRFSKELGLLNMVLTNGTEWVDELIDKTYSIIDEIQISIDGFDEDSCSKIRGKGVFDQALNTVDKFIEKNVKARIAVTPLHENLGACIDKYVDFERNLRDKYSKKQLEVRFSRLMLEGREVKPTNEENQEYKKNIDTIIKKCDENYFSKEFALNHNYNVIFSNCGYGGISIAANGDIYFCNRISDVGCFGNVREVNFENIIEFSEKVKSLSKVDNLIPCSSCEVRNICGGQCRIEYFPKLVSINKDTIDLTHNKFKRVCKEETKNNLYRMMISSNRLLYR